MHTALTDGDGRDERELSVAIALVGDPHGPRRAAPRAQPAERPDCLPLMTGCCVCRAHRRQTLWCWCVGVCDSDRVRTIDNQADPRVCLLFVPSRAPRDNFELAITIPSLPGGNRRRDSQKARTEEAVSDFEIYSQPKRRAAAAGAKDGQSMALWTSRRRSPTGWQRRLHIAVPERAHRSATPPADVD
jgi:hypothetical protein